MTTTIVYGDVSDGYLHNFDPAYATARTGPGDGVNTGTSAFYGQNNNGGTFAVFQTFLRFTYPALAAGDVVAAATVQTYQLTQLSTGVTRDLEVRDYDWAGGGLLVGDWRTPAQLAAAPLAATVRGVQASQGKWATAGSESLRLLVAAGSAVNLILTSSRQRAGSVPTTDEGSSIAAADTSGTSSDPRLVFTTTTNQSLAPAMGGEAQLSDGSWVYLARSGLSTSAAGLWRRTPDGVPDVALASIPLGATSGSWANSPTLQGMTLTVDALDNIFIIGRAGEAANAIRLQAFRKAGGSWTWTAGAIRTQAAPAHEAWINNVSAAWHSTASGTLVIFLAHQPGDGKGGGDPNDVSYLLLSSSYLTADVTVGSLLRGAGSAHDAGLMPASSASQDFGSFTNEVGTGLDVAADQGQPDWGYVASFRRADRVGENGPPTVGRYVLLSTGAGFSHASYRGAYAFGTKDAGARLRVLPVGSGQVALVTADRDTGWGLTVEVLQASGTTPGMVSLGSVHLAGESIPTMPDGPAVAASPAWDAVYSVTENSVWVYYVDATAPTRLRRTSVDLDTYQATRVEVLVHTAASAISAVRTPRNARVTQVGHVSVGGTPSGFASVVDTFNLAPLAPVLTVRANYDATAAATFAWSFQDPNTGDTQSAYQLQVVRVSDGVTVLDTGKVLSATPSRSVAGGTLANGQTYQWRATTWDALDVAGPWSTYGSFTTSAGGSVTITDPATDNIPGVTTNDILVSWSVTGVVPALVRATLVRNDTGALVADTGWAPWVSGDQNYISGMVSDVEHTITVQVENATGVRSGIGSRLITPSYGTPEIPLATVTPSVEGGYVLVSVDNPEAGDLGAPLWDFEALVPSFSDLFARDTAGGWGSGYVRLLGAAAAWSTSLAASRATITPATKVDHTMQLPLASVADVDLTVTLESPDITPDAGANNPRFVVELRYVDASNNLRANVWMTSTGITVNLERREVGVITSTAFPLVSGTTLNSRVRLRLQAIGSITRAKVWLATQPQPAAWTHEVTTTHLAAGLGRVGIAIPASYTGTMPKTFHFSDLVINGVDFSKTSRDWGKVGVTTTPDPTGGESGGGAMKMTATATGLVYTRAPALPVRPGERYAVRARVMRPAGGVARVFLEFWRSDGSLISSAAVDTTTVAGVWQDVTSNGKAPADATQAVYGPGLPTAGVGDVVRVDNLRLTYASDRPEVVRNRILRRPAGSTGTWEVLGECGLDGSFRDYTAPSQVPLEYLVRGESA